MALSGVMGISWLSAVQAFPALRAILSYRRVSGVGRSEGSSASDENARVPHSYEMPRNVIDLSATKRFGEHWEIKLLVRDLLAEKVYYKQFADVTYTDGSQRTVEEVARCYKPGRNIGLQAIYKF